MSKLLPRVALIPGGTRGLGRAIALALAEEGWKLALAHRQDASSAEETAGLLDEMGASYSLHRLDLRVAENAERLVAATLERWGEVGAAINALGAFQRRPLLDEDPKSWREAWASNLDAVFYLCRAVAPPMQQLGVGRIINFGVVNAESAPPTVGAHHLAKAAVANLSRCLARSLASEGITVNTLELGFIDGGVALPQAPKIPAGRLGRREEVVGAVRYLLSEQAAYTNGAQIAISGAWGI